jgi:hypothetical protein
MKATRSKKRQVGIACEERGSKDTPAVNMYVLRRHSLLHLGILKIDRQNALTTAKRKKKRKSNLPF